MYAGTTGLSGGMPINMNNTNASSRYSIDATVIHTDHGLYPISYDNFGGKMWEIYAGYHMLPYVELDTQNAMIITPGTLFAVIAKSEFAGDKVGANIHIFEEGEGY